MPRRKSPRQANGTTTEQSSIDDESFSIRIRLAEDAPPEARFVNHAVANFNGTEFLITFAQVVPPADREGAAWQRVVQNKELEAAVVARFAMPVAKFAEMAAAWAGLVAGLRERGLIDAGSGGGSSGH